MDPHCRINPSPSLNTRFLQGPTGLLAALLVGGGLLLAACTSDTPPGAAADSTDASPTTAVSHASPSGPSTPTNAESTPDTRSLAEKLEDASVETKVKQALFRDSDLRVFPFRLTVRDGHLILRGNVNTPDQYRRAERIARRVEGVTALTNRLTMGGRPVTEERLAETDSDSTETAGEDTAVYHTVREGDTLWKIARQYRASVERIRSLNDLRTNSLSPGQRLRVR